MDVTIRTSLQQGDLGAIVHLHGILYAREFGFDTTFEAYVAGPLAQFACSASSRERVWIAERADQIVGCVAIVAASPTTAQLRWYLVDPIARGIGLGTELLRRAIEFGRDCAYDRIILWTVSQLTVAAHRYRSAGFRKVEERP